MAIAGKIKHIFKINQVVFFFNLLLLIIALLFLAEKWLLLFPPAIIKLSFADIILLVLFYIFLLLLLRIKIAGRSDKSTSINFLVFNQLIIIGIFSLALLLGIFSSSADFQTPTDVARNKAKLLAAVESGYKLCQQVKDNKISEESVEEMIKNVYPSDFQSQEAAEKTYREFLIHKRNIIKEEIIKNLFPTVPVLYKQWTCNNFGCSYEDDNFIWTISSTNRNWGLALNSFSLFFLAFTTNRAFNKNKVSSAKKLHG